MRATNNRGLTKTSGYQMDAYGRMVTRTLGNGVATTYQYDDAGALTKMSHGGLTKSGAAMSLIYSYEYDKAGNRTKIALDDTSAAGTMDSTTAYDYDALGRLTREARSGTPSGAGDYTATWAFDSVGNRIAMTKVGPGAVTKVSTYAYNAGEQLTALTRTSNGTAEAVQTYLYDAAGELTRVVRTTGGALTKTYSWDHEGRLTRAVVDDGTAHTVDYGYSPAGKRYLRVEGGVTKAYSYQGDNLASTGSSDNANLHSVFSVQWGGIANVDARHDVNITSDTTTSRFYLYNHRGDVAAVLDASANLTYAYEYGAYGDVTADYNSGGGSAPTDDILLTGKNLDPGLFRNYSG
ncbi:MAG: hypothetical protein M1457_01330 [bacterium]|nr:hypothetical protein [bacterium]